MVAEKSLKAENIIEVFPKLHTSTATRTLTPGKAKAIIVVKRHLINSSNKIETDSVIGLKIFYFSFPPEIYRSFIHVVIQPLKKNYYKV
jgi:hypothetical protein